MYSKMSQLYKNVSSPFASFVSIRNICSISSYYFWLTIAEVAGVERLPRGTLMQDLFNIMARLLNITLVTLYHNRQVPIKTITENSY